MTNVLRNPYGLLALLLLGGQPGLAQVMATTKSMTKSTANSTRNTTQTAQAVQLREVRNGLKTQYKVDILFEDRLVSNLLVAPNVVEPTASLERNLTSVLRPQGLRYKRVKAGVYVVLAETRAPKVSAADEPLRLPTGPTGADLPAAPAVGSLTQPTLRLVADQPVSGRVTDGGTGNGLPGVSVVLKGTGRGTTTDGDGNFRLNVPDGSANAILVFSFIGYVSKEEPVGGRSTLAVTLTADEKLMSEVVVVC